ncbi:MAG: hypothetical protein ABI886_06030 [Betaproteobacteria bacterium]
MNLNRPELPTFRPLIGLAAFAMMAITIGAAVVVPEKLYGLDFDSRTLLASGAGAPTAVVISPARLDIVAVREQKAALESARPAPSKAKQAG